jgi:replicative DNA helicase
VHELIDLAEKIVFDVGEQQARGGGGFRSITRLLTDTITRVEKMHDSGNPVIGLSTGFRALDEKTAGLQRGELIIAAGRPSMGKTALAMNLAEHAATKAGATVAVFSMEMGAQSLTMRMLSSIGGLNHGKVRTGNLADSDWPRITHAVQTLGEAKLFIDDTGALTAMDLRARCRRLAKEHGDLDLIVIDYLQLMTGKGENRNAELSSISRALKALAKEMRAPVIALSQLNRAVEQRANKRPVLSDLRESGAIEQDADLVLMLYRDEVYNENTTDKGIAELNIAKQRNGPIGNIRLRFSGDVVRFDNLALHADTHPVA